MSNEVNGALLIEDVVTGFVAQLQQTSTEVSRDFLDVSCNAIRRIGKVTAKGAEMQINAGLLSALIKGRENLIATIDRLGTSPRLAGLAQSMIGKFDEEFRAQLSDVFESQDIVDMLAVMPRPAILNDNREVVEKIRNNGRFSGERRLANNLNGE